jgi:electron transfer flavoprotein alpha subunit
MILVYSNTDNGLSKASKEVVTYAKKLGDSVTVVTNGNASSDALAELGQYGASKVLVDRSVSTDDVQQVIDLVASAAESTGATSIIFSHDLTAKAVAPRLSVRLKAGLVSGATEVPNGDGAIRVNVFSGKAFGFVKVN